MSRVFLSLDTFTSPALKSSSLLNIIQSPTDTFTPMAKKKSPAPRWTKKSSVSKARDIEKLIEDAKRRAGRDINLGTPTVRSLPASPERKVVRIPLVQTVPRLQNKHLPTFARPTSLKTTTKHGDAPSFLNHEGFYFVDRRHENKPLTYLPNVRCIERDSVPVPTGHFPFLELPGELRNKIYAYAIPSECYALKWVQDTQKSRSLTCPSCWSPNGLRPDVLQQRRATRNLRGVNRGAVMEEIYRRNTPVSLLWVCKKTYAEAASVFYSKSTFELSLLGTLRHFLDNVTKENKAVITRISLNNQAYGHPARTENAVFKHAYDRSWENLCWRVADQCPSLTNLALRLDLKRCPITFGPMETAHLGGFSTHWMQPLWAFEDRNIKRCVLELRSSITDDCVLEVESQSLRRSILGDAWDNELEMKRDAFGHENPVRRKNAGVFVHVGGDLHGT